MTYDLNITFDDNLITGNKTIDRAIEQLLKLREQGCAILIVTHDFDVARHMEGHVLIMKEGRMVERGSAKEVLQNPKAGYTKELIEAIHLGWG